MIKIGVSFIACIMSNMRELASRYKLESFARGAFKTTKLNKSCVQIIVGICNYDVTSANNSWYSVIMTSRLRIITVCKISKCGFLFSHKE